MHDKTVDNYAMCSATTIMGNENLRPLNFHEKINTAIIEMGSMGQVVFMWNTTWKSDQEDGMHDSVWIRYRDEGKPKGANFCYRYTNVNGVPCYATLQNHRPATGYTKENARLIWDRLASKDSHNRTFTGDTAVTDWLDATRTVPLSDIAI